VVAVTLAVVFSAAPAAAQKVPEALEQEILIKGILMSFNDANITGNYAVFHARLAKPFRDQYSAERLGVPFLGEVPLHATIREKSDAGLPVVATEPDGPHAKIYRDIAARVRDQLTDHPARAAPKIVIEG